MGKNKIITPEQALILRDAVVQAIARARVQGLEKAADTLFEWWNDGEREELISGAAGIYQAKEFAQIVWKDSVTNLTHPYDDEALQTLRKGPPNSVFGDADASEDYVEIWANVFDNWSASFESRDWHLESNESDGSVDLVSNLYISEEEVRDEEL